MTEYELIDAITSIKCEFVPAFQVATTPEQWKQLFVEQPDNIGQLAQRIFNPDTLKITFPKCQQLTQNDLFDAVEQITKGFDPDRCRSLLERLIMSRNELACTKYREIWNKQPPVEYVCNLLEEKLNAQHNNTHPIIEQSTFDDNKLKSLFIPVFYEGKDYIGIDNEHTTRYNDFVRRLNVLLNDRKTTDATIGSIVVLLYKSQYKAQRYKTTLKSKGKFAPLTKAFFDAINRKAPKYIRPNSYSPNDQILTMFGEVLRVKRNYKGEIESNK